MSNLTTNWSPRWSLRYALPSMYKSLLISAGGVVFAVLLLLLMKRLLPDQDFSNFEAALATGIGAWIVNTVRLFISEKQYT